MPPTHLAIFFATVPKGTPCEQPAASSQPGLLCTMAVRPGEFPLHQLHDEHRQEEAELLLVGNLSLGSSRTSAAVPPQLSPAGASSHLLGKGPPAFSSAASAPCFWAQISLIVFRVSLHRMLPNIPHSASGALQLCWKRGTLTQSHWN